MLTPGHLHPASVPSSFVIISTSSWHWGGGLGLTWRDKSGRYPIEKNSKSLGADPTGNLYQSHMTVLSIRKWISKNPNQICLTTIHMYLMDKKSRNSWPSEYQAVATSLSCRIQRFSSGSFNTGLLIF